MRDPMEKLEIVLRNPTTEIEHIAIYLFKGLL